MRTGMMAAMITGLLATALQVMAGDGCLATAPNCQAAGAAGGCNACDPACGHCDGACNDGGCGLFGHPCGCGLFGRKCGSGIEGLDRFANCACNGSYNYPVPPLYTYHWPGMYKQVRMTDYHSAWRFPPLKKYEDEPLPTIEVPAAKAAAGPRLLKPVSMDEAPAPLSAPKAKYFTDIEPLSSRLSR